MRAITSRTRRGAGWVAAVGATTVLAACASTSGDTEATGSGPEVSDLKVGVIQIAGLTPIYAAKELGYFEDEGLNVTLETSSGGAASLPLLAQGDLQITNAPAVSVILAQEQGFDFVVLPPALDAPDEAPGQTAVLASKKSGVTSLADLEGKKVAVNTINSVNWLYNRALLEQAGVDVDSVTYVEVPFPSMIDALKGGAVDAIDVPQPFFHIAEQTGDVQTLGYTFVDVQPGLHVTSFSATKEWAEENPRTLSAFNRAMTKAVEYLRENEEEAKRLIAEYTGADEALVNEIPLDSWSTELDIDQVQKTADLMHREGLIKEEVDVSTFVMNPEND